MKQRGFALLITITLLAFLVLLLVSLASLTRVETQVASNTQQLAQARQNALMALNIALGQLQKYAGPDQRVTAPASFALNAPATQLSNAQKGLKTPVPGTEYWLGVWGNSSPANDIYASTPQPVLLNWLVSGNEQTTTPVAAADGHMTTPSATAASPTYKPNLAVTSLSLSSKATDTLSINGQPAIMLVGPQSVGTAAGALDRYIAAPMVTIQSSNVAGLANAATTIGHYAYWIGDEGVKARYNLRDRYTAIDPKTSADARYRLRTPARSAIELLSGETNYPVNSALLDNVVDKNQFRYADSNLVPQDQQAAYHDLTTWSNGVLANSQAGGLRTDLTHALHPTAPSTDPDPINPVSLGANFAGKTIIPAVTPTGYSQSVVPTQSPKWEVLQSFADLSSNAWKSTPVEVRPASATTTGVSPVITQNRLMFSLDSTPEFTDKTPASRRFFICVSTAFIISNPYTFPIKATNGVDFSYAITTPTNSEWGINLTLRSYSGATKVETSVSPFDRNKFGATSTFGGIVNYFPLLVNKITYGNDGARSVLGNVRFQTPGFTLQPGETKTYTLPGVITSAANSTGGDLALTEGSNLGYYKYDTGVDVPPHPNSTSAGLGYFVRQLTAEAMSLQMAVHGSPALDGLLSQPQTGALQTIINADLSANNAPGATSTAPSAPKPQSFTVYAADASRTTPLGFGGYGMSLALPVPDDSFYSDTLTTMNNYRAYADYNLTAQSFALPPVSAFLTATNASANIETVPPLTRKYIRGPNFSYDSGAASLTSNQFNEGLLTPRWGNTTAILTTTGVSGKATTILYDVPLRATTDETALFSIGQLQHADLTGDDNYLSVSYQPRNAVGNSVYNAFVSRATTIDSRPRASPQHGDTVPVSGNVRMFDLSYLLNTALWDNYFFSSLIQTGSLAGTPANQRLAFTTAYHPTPTQLGIGAGDTKVTDLSGNGTQLLPEMAAARYMMIKGAFNINSTSVDAWRSVLAGARNLALSTDTTGIPFALSLNQSLSAANADQENADGAYAGYRRLTDGTNGTVDQITPLATNIVAEIRKRGPFVSLAHFINRQIDTATSPSGYTATSANGALQAAIDASSVNAPATATNQVTTMPTTAYAANGVTTLGNRAMNVPGWLTQADILQSLGPVLSARSDTFTIRVYGDVINPLDQTTVTSRAWCEAIVQRNPDYMDTTVSAAASPTTTTNKSFGRRFRIVSFRWLSSTDI